MPQTNEQRRHPSTACRSRRKKKKTTTAANRARHRLLSIRHDVDTIVRPSLEEHSDVLKNLALVANERCGTWYAYPLQLRRRQESVDNTTSNNKNKLHFCYFKSTDGHSGTWNLSLKRLNLQVIELMATVPNNNNNTDDDNGRLHPTGCVVVDSSVRKEMPDAFSRTIPLWCACMNRIARLYQRELGFLRDTDDNSHDWDDKLYTPHWLVSRQEHDTMEALIDDRVQALYDSRAIVNPAWLATTLTKPLRPFWWNHDDARRRNDNMDNDQLLTSVLSNYFTIVCLNASTSRQEQQQQFPFWYTPGAADDEDSWARQLTPQLFWDHYQDLLSQTKTRKDAANNGQKHGDDEREDDNDNDNDDDYTDRAIDALVKKHLQNELASETNSGDNTLLHPQSQDSNDDTSCFDFIGNNLNIAIGTRRAGRPPHCWQHFDAILNVTDMEYATIHDTASSCSCSSSSGDGGPSKYYLQLPVKEGKRDKVELEKWMAVGIVFCMTHVQAKRRVLIHCAQGKDRSVAVAMATIVLFCDLTFPLQWRDGVVDRLSFSGLLDDGGEGEGFTVPAQQQDDCLYKSSGLSERIVQALQGREGRDRLLSWVRKRRLRAHMSTGVSPWRPRKHSALRFTCCSKIGKRRSRPDRQCRN